MLDRRILRRISRHLALATLCLLGVESEAADAAEPLTIAQMRPGVYVHVGLIEDAAAGNGGDVANLGFVVGSRCVAVIDTGSTPAVGMRLRAAIERVTPLPVCFVINTHMHPDHVLGNSAFNVQPMPQFIGHTKLAAALAARERSYLNALQRDFASTALLVYPSRAVDGTLALDLGGRTLQLKAWPTAHTDNDLSVYDPQTRTLFMSDLLFVGHLPVLDGQLRGWIKLLGEIASIDVALAVPGHGAPSIDWPAVLAPELSYLTALRDQTRQAIKAGETIQQAVPHVATKESAPWQLAELFHRRNVTAAYAELEWED